MISHYSRIIVVFLQMQGKKAEMVFLTKRVLKESESCRLFSQICAIRACGQNCPYAEIEEETSLLFLMAIGMTLCTFFPT